jgi:hypothetical protein
MPGHGRVFARCAIDCYHTTQANMSRDRTTLKRSFEFVGRHERPPTSGGGPKQMTRFQPRSACVSLVGPDHRIRNDVEVEPNPSCT